MSNQVNSLYAGRPSYNNTVAPGPILNEGPANLQKMAEVNPEFERSVQQFPKEAKTAQDGMDRQSSTSSNTEPKGPEPKAPANDTQAAVNQANREAIAELKKHNAFELMKMVRSGDIPAAILDNPVAMNLMLDRVQEFSRMIQMMTNMMQVEHDTLTAIIRNIKA
jgi:hypothetical protein